MATLPGSVVPAPVDVGRPRILVVDDEPSICTIVRKTLSRESYQIETTTCSLEALELLRSASYDLLITDIKMAELDGLELAERARVLQPLLGIVIMTGYGSFENIARALHTGIADFITKPFDIEELRVAVVRTLARQRLQQDNIRLQTLVKVFEYSQAINSTLELSALYNVVTDIVLHEVGALGVALWTIDQQGRLTQAVGVGLASHLGETARDLAQQVFHTARLQTSRVDARTAGATGDTLALVGMPLAVRDEQLGALVVADRAQHQPALIELLGIIANQSALAIRNARQYHAVRELDQLKSEFIGIASHELRTPLSLVLGYSSLLRHRLHGRDKEALQHIIDGALRIGDIVEDLVNLRRSDRQQLDLELAEVNIWDLLREVVSELQPLAAARQITLRLACPAPPVVLAADREKLSLALAHLIDNATKFNEAGGVVRIVGRAPRMPEQPDVLIEVHDTGIGIAQADLDRVFDRFYQTAPSITRARNGLGLGLALTKLFVELHGGQVHVRSVAGQGSVFQVRLPVVVPRTSGASQT